MKNVANARFAIKSWDERPYSEGEDLPRLTRAAVAKTFTGDIAGEGHVEYLMMYRADGSATFVGLERIVGHVAGKAGSFVLHRTGVFENGKAKESYFVIPGSATGEFHGLRGDGTSAVGHGTEHPVTLHYEFIPGRGLSRARCTPVLHWRRMRYLTLNLLLGLSVTFVGTIHAQVRPDPGARVRVTSPQLREGTRVGSLDLVTDDTVVVGGHAIGRASISRFEVSEPRRSQKGAGMGLGFFGGLALGGGLCALKVGYSREDGGIVCAPRALLLGLGGLLVGNIIGANLSRGEQWRIASLGTIQIAPSVRLSRTLRI